MKKFLFEISPETRGLLAEASRKPTLLDRWSADQRILKIIATIRAAGEPGAIGHLLQLGLAESGSVRSAAREAIRELVALLPIQATPELDEAVRRKWRYLDLWYGLRPETVAATNIITEDDAAFLRVASCHPSGFVREQATKRLSQDESYAAMPFLLVRAVDWVAPVRAAAEVEICRRLHRDYADALVSCLSLLHRLRGSHRFAPELRDSIERFLREPDSRGALKSGLRSNDRIVRRRSFALAVDSPAFEVREIVEAAASDPDVLIRKWAFTFAQSEMVDLWPKLRTRAARDSFSPIRRIAFDSLNAEAAPPSDELFGFLLDSSPAIRHSAQDRVPKLLNVSARDYYRSAINAHRGARSICALGLAEVGGATDAPVIAALMNDSSAKTRAATIRALRLLKIVDSRALIRAVNSDVPSVTREAVISLLSARIIRPDLIWKEALANQDPIVRRTVLKLFNTEGKWIRLRVYLEAVAANDESLSAFAIQRVRIWLAQYNRSFTLPGASESGQISSLLAGVSHKLPVEVDRELGFVVKSVLKPAHNAWPSTTRSDVR